MFACQDSVSTHAVAEAPGPCADSIPVLLCLLQARSKGERRSQQPAWVCADRHLCNESPPAHKAQSAWPVAPEGGWDAGAVLGRARLLNSMCTRQQPA